MARSLNLLSLWSEVGVIAKPVLLAQAAMSHAILALAVAALRRKGPEHQQCGLLSIAASALMPGVLGTVVGIINACMAVTEHGTLDTRMVAAGQAEALPMTALGLLIGVIALRVRTAVHTRLVRRQPATAEATIGTPAALEA
jgi:hypothetical protein